MLRALLIVAVIAPTAAWACSYRQVHGPPLVSPANATNVPLNVEVRFESCLGTDPWTFTVEDGGTLVPVTVGRRGKWTVLTPDAPLSPNTRYVLQVQVPDWTVNAFFITGTERDDTSPLLSGSPTIVALTERDPCGNQRDSATLTWPQLSDDGTPGEALQLEAFIEDDTPAVHMQPAVVGAAPKLEIGKLETLCRYGLELTNHTHVRVRAVDWAGNFSELSEPYSAKNDCGCSSGAPGAFTALALMLLFRAASSRPTQQASPRRGPGRGGRCHTTGEADSRQPAVGAPPAQSQ